MGSFSPSIPLPSLHEAHHIPRRASLAVAGGIRWSGVALPPIEQRPQIDGVLLLLAALEDRAQGIEGKTFHRNQPIHLNQRNEHLLGAHVNLEMDVGIDLFGLVEGICREGNPVGRNIRLAAQMENPVEGALLHGIDHDVGSLIGLGLDGMSEYVLPRSIEQFVLQLELERLLDVDPPFDTPQADRLKLMALLIETYEKEHFPFELPDPIDAIIYRMEEQGLKQHDLIPFIGSKSKVSEVLSRKRPLSLKMIRALTAGLGIPAEVLLQEQKTNSLIA